MATTIEAQTQAGTFKSAISATESCHFVSDFHVHEVNAAIARVKEHGGTISHDPSVVPGGQEIVHCLDAQGAAFGIVGPERS